LHQLLDDPADVVVGTAEQAVDGTTEVERCRATRNRRKVEHTRVDDGNIEVKIEVRVRCRCARQECG
jgi:hypothetical protein